MVELMSYLYTSSEAACVDVYAVKKLDFSGNSVQFFPTELLLQFPLSDGQD